MNFIRWFTQIRMSDVSLVGGKNASLGEMVSSLASSGIRVPQGFAVTVDGYWHYVDENKLREKMNALIKHAPFADDQKKIARSGHEIRALLMAGDVPPQLAHEIIEAYHLLSRQYKQRLCDVAVRSSATAEDLPNASFAGQLESYLNVRGDAQLVMAYKKALASLFTDRAITYRIRNGFNVEKIGLSVGVQKMVRADRGSSGVAFSLDTETGFRDVIIINAAWGLGESIVQGVVNPDEFMLFKPTLNHGVYSIIKKRCSVKKKKLVYTKKGSADVAYVAVPKKDQIRPSLSDEHVVELARMVKTIEDHYSALQGTWAPMDVEWARDGIDHQLYIVQARPETVHAHEAKKGITTYEFEQQPTEADLIITGQSVGQGMASGRARVVHTLRDADRIEQGDIIVTPMTDPDWGPVLARAGGIVTDLGGRTCHAAIVSREMGKTAVVGTSTATNVIKDGSIITLDASHGAMGYVYRGAIPFRTETIAYDQMGTSPVPLMINMADPNQAFAYSQLPVAGVGLARMEFIIMNVVHAHPMALLYSEKIRDKKTARVIQAMIAGYADGRSYFVDTLSRNIACIAAAFYPRRVVVRTSDFKTNEYRNLIGGSFFEPHEENPMIGFRGAARYVHPTYRPAFDAECAALKRVRDEMGFDNVQIMIPFVRTVHEAAQVVDALAENGLVRGNNNLALVMMCEVPSNVILMDQFCQLFDEFSIGSNDLTQLVLGTDRDSAMLVDVFDEQNEAVKTMITMAIEGAHRNGRRIGICGQVPSDYPDFCTFLIDQGIDSISLNPDNVLPFLHKHRK